MHLLSFHHFHKLQEDQDAHQNGEKYQRDQCDNCCDCKSRISTVSQAFNLRIITCNKNQIRDNYKKIELEKEIKSTIEYALHGVFYIGPPG